MSQRIPVRLMLFAKPDPRWCAARLHEYWFLALVIQFQILGSARFSKEPVLKGLL